MPRNTFGASRRMGKVISIELMTSWEPDRYVQTWQQPEVQASVVRFVPEIYWFTDKVARGVKGIIMSPSHILF